MRQAFAFEEALETMEVEERSMIREIFFPLVKTAPCGSPSRRGSPAVSCVRAASILRLLPNIQHFFCFDFRWEPKFLDDLTWNCFTHLKHLRKLSLYMGDGFRASLVMEYILSRLGDCKSLVHLDLAATETFPRDGLVECKDLPPIQSLSLILARPSGYRDVRRSFDSRFWPHFVGRLATTLRHLAVNVGDYLLPMIDSTGPQLQSLTLTPFTEAYETDWWEGAEKPDLKYLSLGWTGWATGESSPCRGKTCAAVEVAILGGYDSWNRTEEDAMEALRSAAELPALKKIIATELEPDLEVRMAEELRKRRPGIDFVSVPYGEVDMCLLADCGRIAYKHTPL